MKNKKIAIILSFVIALISTFIIQHPASVYADSNGLCVQFKYTHGTMGDQYAWSSSEGKSNAVCSKTGKAEKDDLFIEGSDDIVSFSLEGDTLKMKIWTLGTEVTDSRACGGGQCPTERTYDTKEYSLGQYSSFDALSNAIIEDYSAHFPIEKKSNSTPVMVTEKITIPDDFTIKYGDMNIATPNNLTTEYGDDNDDDDEEKVTCMNSGGAESLGWIVCPLLTWMQDAAKNVYNDFVKPNLEVQPALFQGSNNATQNAWSTFQGLANLCFVILLLVIIFSQLTGVGIDNYGIKKILPKLIVVAVLVNLSYLICLICVDLSNILGNALQALFESMSPNVSDHFIANTEGTVQTVGTTTITAIALLGLLFAVGTAVWQNPAILLTLLIAALGVLISIFFLFILLAARKAAIVVLTVVSPVAFVCYMLPNTKKLFDKWLNFWEALLLLYPICGLLIGGGDFVSTLMLAASSTKENDFFTSFTAMIVGIIPVFFIPTVLKSSFAALGSIGSKITGFGDRMRGGATKGLRNSERYKNAQRMGLERQTRKRAGLKTNGNMTKLGERRARFAQTGFGRFFGADKNRAHYVNAAKKNVAEGEEANATLTNALSRSGIAALAKDPTVKDPAKEYYRRNFAAAAQKGDIRGMNSVLAAASSSGYMKDKDIAKMIRDNDSTISAGFSPKSDKEEDKEAAAATRAAWMRDTASKYGGSFLGTDFELKNYMQKGGTGNLGGYGEYATGTDAEGKRNIGIDDIKPEDILKLSGDSLAGLAKAGVIDQSMAQQVLAMNPNMSTDKKIMLGAIANGNADSSTISSVDEFKKDAETLMNNHAATGTTTIVGADEVTVDAWAAPTPQSVNVVQNFNGGGSQINPVEVNGSISIPHSPSPTAPAPQPSNPTVPTQTFDVSAMSDDTLLDMATNPNVPMSDPTRIAAELEWQRRTNPNNHDETFEGGSGI